MAYEILNQTLWKVGYIMDTLSDSLHAAGCRPIHDNSYQAIGREGSKHDLMHPWRICTPYLEVKPDMSSLW